VALVAENGAAYWHTCALRSRSPPGGTDLMRPFPFPFRAASVTMCLAGKVHGLKRFAHINTLGCIKISKKHDKHSNIPLKQVCVCDSGRRHQGLGFKV
jgi:hypothetical protein